MAFGYRRTTISGSLPEKEGTIEFIRELKDFMEEVGWTTTEDRTAEPGGTYPNTSKLVMQSEGEAGAYPTFHMIVTSGISATPAANFTLFQMATGYDTDVHDVAGVVTNVYTQTLDRLNTRSQGDFEAFMSGDSEALIIITKQIGVNPISAYDGICIGRANSFSSTADNPYPLYIFGSAATNLVASDTTGVSSRVIGGNPPRDFLPAVSGSRVMYYQNVNTANQPYMLGAADSIYLAVPWLLLYYGIATKFGPRGAMGTIRNAWLGAGTGSGMFWENILTASGTGGVQTYMPFPISTSDFSWIMRVT